MATEPHSRPLALVRFWPLALLLIGLGTAFFLLEERRSDRLFAETLRFFETLEGEVIGVEVRASHVTRAHWDDIRQFDGIERVTLIGAETVDDGLAPLKSFTRFHTLIIEDGRFLTDNELRSLADLPRLTNVQLTKTPGISRMELPQLTYLRITDCPSISDDAVPSLVGMTQLEYLEMNGTSLTIDGLVRLRHERQDLTLRVSRKDFAGLYIESLDQMDTLLPLLTLPHNWQTGKWDPDPLKQHQSLSVTGPAAGAALPTLAELYSELTRLWISQTTIPAMEIAWPPMLTSLELSHLSADSDLSDFAAAKSLERVRFLGWNERPINGYQFLSALPSLRHVDLTGTVVEPQDIRLVAGIESLEILDISGKGQPELTASLITALLEHPNLPNLTWLDISNGPVSPELAERLQQTFPNATIKIR